MSERYDAWVGRAETVTDRVDPWPAAALTAALGRGDAPQAGEPLPPYWHHLYTRKIVAAAETGPDGHPRRSDLLPPAPGRRMWAGGRVVWYRPLRVGEPVERLSTVRAVTEKAGRSGPLVFVLLEHRYSSGGELALVEEQDVVYREGAASGTAPPAPSEASWQRAWQPDPVLLFRYSALTYNGHRIHYDQAYAREVEGYPGLVVHGPLLATFMLDLLRRETPGLELQRFSFRAVSAMLVNRPCTAQGTATSNGAQLWIAHENGTLAMSGEVEGR
jgi:3-methylfumaryl-CoA hydratase